LLCLFFAASRVCILLDLLWTFFKKKTDVLNCFVDERVALLFDREENLNVVILDIFKR
jgi:hypothetical protein